MSHTVLHAVDDFHHQEYVSIEELLLVKLERHTT